MKGEKGTSLLETVIGVLLFSVIGAAFLSGLGTASIAVFGRDERQTSKNLALSQMEYVRSQPYAATYDPSSSITETYPGYSVAIYADDVDSASADVQQIRIVVSHQGRPVVTSAGATLVDYKANR